MAQQKNHRHEHTDLFGNPIEEPAPDPAVHISPEMEQYRAYMHQYTVEELHKIRKCLGFEFKKGNKDDLVSAALGFLSLLEQKEQFRQWFESLPSYLSLAIEKASFKGYIDAVEVKKAAGTPVSTGFRFYYSAYQQTNPNLRLGIFDLYGSYGRKLLVIQPLFRRLLSSLLPPPPQYWVTPCQDQELGGWSAEETLSESMPLLLKAIDQLLEDRSRHEKILRRGLNKTDIKELRKSSAFPMFPVGARTGIDPIELITRFIMIDPEQLGAVRTTDVRDFIKELIANFFTIPQSGKIISHYLRIGSNFEFAALCPHLSKEPGPRRYGPAFRPYPPSRSVFYQLLTAMAESGNWYNVDDTAESIRMQALTFTIVGHDHSAPELLLKGEELDLPEGTLNLDSWEKGFVPDISLSHHLITRPLLKSYCYLMASLGLLEIQEEEPEKPLKKKAAFSPISPSDGLSRVRITPFGSWCLGTSQEKPELREVSYEAIADRELPIVTYRGQSLECKVFLERTGDPIGEDRFRVSEASFVRGCNSPTDIEHRIDEFHRLIAKEPAGHWEELFSRIRQRARLFEHEEPCVMIQLPEDRELRRVFLEDKKLSSLVVRAEGGRIVVTQQNYKKLRKALEEFGVLKG